MIVESHPPIGDHDTPDPDVEHAGGEGSHAEPYTGRFAEFGEAFAAIFQGDDLQQY
jgi:hypothetical protein